jgi:Arc/MetJ-type ribon-helix-helix transcriptional regulator
MRMGRRVISLSLPEELWMKMDEQHVAGGYASVSEYIRELVRNDLENNPAELAFDPKSDIVPAKKRFRPNRW